MLYLYLDPGKLLLLYRLCLSGRNLYKQNLNSAENSDNFEGTKGFRNKFSFAHGTLL